MTREAWTRRLDDRVLGSTGVLVVLALACAYFLTAAVSAALDGAALAGVIYSVLTLLSAQAIRTQWRARKRLK